MKNFSGTPLIPPPQGNIPYSGIKICPTPTTIFNDAYLSINWDDTSVLNNGINVNLDNQTGGQPPLDQILSVYIDNLNVTTDVYIVFPDTGFTAHCPPNTARFTNVLTNNRQAKIYAGLPASNQTRGITLVHFLNCLENPFYSSEGSMGGTGGGVDIPIVSQGLGLSATGFSSIQTASNLVIDEISLDIPLLMGPPGYCAVSIAVGSVTGVPTYEILRRTLFTCDDVQRNLPPVRVRPQFGLAFTPGQTIQAEWTLIAGQILSYIANIFYRRV